MSLLRLSPARLRAGPGPSLCNPVATTNSDGPFRTRKFKLPKIPRDYNNHLPTADVSRLVSQAEQYLFNPQTPFRDTWETFLKRCSHSCHLLKPIDAAIVLRTVDERNADPQNLLISKVIAEQLHSCQRVKKIPGCALVTFFDVYSSRLPLAQPMLAALVHKIPESMDELNAADVLKILDCLRKAEMKDPLICRKVSRKVMSRIPLMNIKGKQSCTLAVPSVDLRSLLQTKRVSAAVCHLHEACVSFGQ